MAITKVDTNINDIRGMSKTKRVNSDILQVLKLEKDFIITSYKDETLSTALISKYLQNVYGAQFTKTKTNKVPQITALHIKNFLMENNVKIRTAQKRKTTKK